MKLKYLLKKTKHYLICLYILIVFALFCWLCYEIGVSDGRGQIVSLYKSPQPIRVTQHLLKEAGYYHGLVDGIVGNGTLSGWKQWDRENVGFVEDILKGRENK